MNLTNAQIENLLNSFSRLKILVIGDFMLDHFLWGRVDRISPEAPVPVVEVERETSALGGAGNVANNIRSLGATAIPVGAVGDDQAGAEIVRLLGAARIDSSGIVPIQRPTTIKTRILAHQQQIVRVDREERSPVSAEIESAVASKFLERLANVDAVIISDYAKGAITPGLLAAILPPAKTGGKIVCVDPKPRYFASYSEVSIITPNQLEASQLLGYPIASEQDLEAAAKRIFDLIHCKALLITRGEKGMALFANGQMSTIATRAKEVYDVTGAGDTVISMLSLALAAGAELIDAVHLTNIAAGLVVGKIGTATVTTQEILSAFSSIEGEGSQ